MKKIVFLMTIFFQMTVFSQVNIDFESGNIVDWTESSDNRWIPSEINPINGSFSLHHQFDNNVASRDNISLPIDKISINSESIVWRFQIKYGYNPSDDNNWGIFLFSDTNANEMYPGGDINGYVLGVNFVGTSDFIKIWKITSGETLQILNTEYNWQEKISSSGIAGIEVKRSTSGDWSVFIDDNGNFDNLNQIGETINDMDFSESNYFGISYEYTLSADQLLWFDDLYIGPEIIDSSKPKIVNIKAISKYNLLLYFNENVDIISSQTNSNYSVSDGIGQPTLVSRDPDDNRKVDLTFSESFIDEQVYSINVSAISDLNENFINDTSIQFNYSSVKPLEIEIISAKEISILFNKELDEISACEPTNYFVDNNLGNPVGTSIDPENLKLVRINFQNDFINDVSCSLKINNIKDLYGNIISEHLFYFTYHTPKEFDIVINEIMCDINPSPNVLPQQKYIEIYNMSDYDLNLESWTIQIGDNSKKSFPKFIFPSKEFAIICDDLAVSDFLTLGRTIPILNPAELTTTGKRITIRDHVDKIIEDIFYSKDWYNDEEKDKGGWSLERIDPENFCGENNNWTAAKEFFGGTPGFINSVYRENIDNETPILTDYQLISSNYIILTFSKNISFVTGIDLLNYSLYPGNIRPELAFVKPENRLEVHLIFSEQLIDKQEYILSIENLEDNCKNCINPTDINFVYERIHPEELSIISENQIKIRFSETVDLFTSLQEENYECNNGIGIPELVLRESTDTAVVYLAFSQSFPDAKECILSLSGIKDLNGNNMRSSDMSFLYYLPKASDIVINEILFNPFTDGNDFIELYNRSEYEIDLKDFYLGQKHLIYPDSLTTASKLSEDNLLLKPNEFIVFTKDKNNLLLNYFSENEDMIRELSDIPNYQDEEGIVSLIYKAKEIIDEFCYDKDMHFKLLDDPEGVSLERVNPGFKTQDANNWFSASEDVGFATPAYKNSQFMDVGRVENNSVQIEPYIFSPDNDGIDDFANIHYKFEYPGYVANILIFDSKGNLIKQLGNNLYLSTEGSILWDGLYADHRIAPPGTYVVWFKTFDLSGKIHLFKKAVVLAKKY